MLKWLKIIVYIYPIIKKLLIKHQFQTLTQLFW